MEASGLFVKNMGCFDVGMDSEENRRFWLEQSLPARVARCDGNAGERQGQKPNVRGFKMLQTVCEQSSDFTHFVLIVLSQQDVSSYPFDITLLNGTVSAGRRVMG